MPSILMNDDEIKPLRAVVRLLTDPNPSSDVVTAARVFLQKLQSENNAPRHRGNDFLCQLALCAFISLMTFLSCKNEFIKNEEDTASQQRVVIDTPFLNLINIAGLAISLKALFTSFKQLPTLSEYYNDLYCTFTSPKKTQVTCLDPHLNSLKNVNLQMNSALELFAHYKKIFGEQSLNLKCITVSKKELQNIQNHYAKLACDTTSAEAVKEARDYLIALKRKQFPSIRDHLYFVGLYVLTLEVGYLVGRTLGIFDSFSVHFPNFSMFILFITALTLNIAAILSIFLEGLGPLMKSATHTLYPCIDTIRQQGFTFFTSRSMHSQQQNAHFEVDCKILQNCNLEKLSSAELLALYNKIYGVERLNNPLTQSETTTSLTLRA